MGWSAGDRDVMGLGRTDGRDWDNQHTALPPASILSAPSVHKIMLSSLSEALHGLPLESINPALWTSYL